MPIAKVKATYSLDVETVRELESMAKRLGISKSAALRRAIHLAASAKSEPGEDQLAALDELQRELDDSQQALEEWEQKARELRLTSSRL